MDFDCASYPGHDKKCSREQISSFTRYPLHKLPNLTALTYPCGLASELPHALIWEKNCLILCTLELINRSLQEGNQIQKLDCCKGGQNYWNAPTDLKIYTFFLAPRTGFHAIKLMKSADGFSKQNGHQRFTQFALQYLLCLPFAALTTAHLSALVSVYLLRDSTLIFPSKDFPWMHNQSVWFIFQPTPNLLDLVEIQTLLS